MPERWKYAVICFFGLMNQINSPLLEKCLPTCFQHELSPSGQIPGEVCDAIVWCRKCVVNIAAARWKILRSSSSDLHLHLKLAQWASTNRQTPAVSCSTELNLPFAGNGRKKRDKSVEEGKLLNTLLCLCLLWRSSTQMFILGSEQHLHLSELNRYRRLHYEKRKS